MHAAPCGPHTESAALREKQKPAQLAAVPPGPRPQPSQPRVTEVTDERVRQQPVELLRLEAGLPGDRLAPPPHRDEQAPGATNPRLLLFLFLFLFFLSPVSGRLESLALSDLEAAPIQHRDLEVLADGL